MMADVLIRFRFLIIRLFLSLPEINVEGAMFSRYKRKIGKMVLKIKSRPLSSC